MHLLQTVPLFAGLTAALSISPRQSTTVPPSVSFKGISFAGTGCAAQNLAASQPANALVWEVPQVNFKAESGANNSKVVDTRLNCQVVINVEHTAGWQYALVKADYYGRVKLPQGSEVISKTTYFYSGATTTKEWSSQYYFDGPFDGLYFRNDRYVDSARSWSPCGSGAMLNINSEIRVGPKSSGTSKPASIEIHNLLGGKVGVNWRKC